jgi:hypothetical protein
VLCGHHAAAPLARLWELAGSWWEHDDAVDWSPGRLDVPTEVLQPDLLAAVNAVVQSGARVHTLGDGKPNWVHHVTPDGVWVETQRSRALGRPPQLVDAWMIQIAWDWLTAHGTLTTRSCSQRAA